MTTTIKSDALGHIDTLTPSIAIKHAKKVKLTGHSGV